MFFHLFHIHHLQKILTIYTTEQKNLSCSIYILINTLAILLYGIFCCTFIFHLYFYKSFSFATFCFVSCTLILCSFFKPIIRITDSVSSHVLCLVVFSWNIKYPHRFLFYRNKFSLPNHPPYSSNAFLFLSPYYNRLVWKEAT